MFWTIILSSNASVPRSQRRGGGRANSWIVRFFDRMLWLPFFFWNGILVLLKNLWRRSRGLGPRGHKNFQLAALIYRSVDRSTNDQPTDRRSSNQQKIAVFAISATVHDTRTWLPLHTVWTYWIVCKLAYLLWHTSLWDVRIPTRLPSIVHVQANCMILYALSGQSGKMVNLILSLNDSDTWLKHS